MALSKRLRYEILRRDNHTCRYCGGSAPDVKLTVDHVLPVALGGSDESTNLVAACADCNAGKSSSNPDQPLVDQVSDDAIRWTRAMSLAVQSISKDVDAAKRYRRKVWSAWREWDSDARRLPNDADMMCSYWHRAGVPVAMVIDAINIAWSNERVPARDTWRYTIGVMKNRIQKMEDRAHELIETGEV